MSISIYYTATRSRGLSEHEIRQVEIIRKKYSVNSDIEEYCRTGRGPNWESFTLYESPTAPAILEGATRLPDNSEESIWIGMQHWCKALSELRQSLPEAEWEVHVDEHDIQWDSEKQAYDPTQ